MKSIISEYGFLVLAAIVITIVISIVPVTGKLMENKILNLTDRMNSSLNVIADCELYDAHEGLYSAVWDGKINPIFYKTGKPGYTGELDMSKIEFEYLKHAENKNSEAIWQHLENIETKDKDKLKNKFSDYRQCVNFVSSFIYEYYGQEQLPTGNGQDIVASLVNDHGWQLLDTPAPGAVFSVSANSSFPYGHTGIIIGVTDSEVTILDGNIGTNHSIRLMTMNTNDWINKYYKNRYIKFAVPKDKEKI